MDISTIIFLISLFIMLTAAISTEMVRNRKMGTLYLAIFGLNVLCFVAGIALFVWTHGALYMVMGMAFSVAVLFITIFKYSEFERTLNNS